MEEQDEQFERQEGEGRGGGEEERGAPSGFKPVQVGDEIDVKIMSKGRKGDGIAKYKGLVIFVAGAEEGQDVKVKITKILRNFAVGEIIV